MSSVAVTEQLAEPKTLSGSYFSYTLPSAAAYPVGTAVSTQDLGTLYSTGSAWSSTAPGIYPAATGSLIYTAPFTGAAAQSVTAKLGQTINVLDFGTPSTATINAAMVAANAQGGGTVILPPQTITLSGTLNLLSGVILQGSGYGLTGTGTPVLASGTILQGNGTFPLIAGNATDLSAPYGSVAALFAAGINDVQIRNLGLSNGTYGIKLGALYQMGGLYPRIYDVFVQNCTQWGIWLENCTQSTIELVAGYFNNHGMMEMASGTALNNFGNSSYRKLVFGRSTANGSGRSFQVGARGAAFGGSIMNDVLMFDLGMSGNVVSSTQAATMANTSTAIGVTDLSKFGVGMPVNFTSTANGFTINVIYFVLSVSGTTGAGNITVGTSMAGTGGQVAIAATGSTAINIFTTGWPQIEIGGTDATSSVSYSSITGASDIEVGGTAHMVFQGITGFTYEGGINHSTSSTCDICIRQVTPQGFRMNIQSQLLIDMDSTGQYIQIHGRQPTFTNANFAGMGITQASATGAGQLNLGGSSTPDLYINTLSNNQLQFSRMFQRLHNQVATGATLNYQTGNLVTFTTAAGGTVTLPAPNTNQAGWSYKIANPNANTVTVSCSLNIIGLGVSGTSFTLAANSCCDLVAQNNGGTMFWARYS